MNEAPEALSEETVHPLRPLSPAGLLPQGDAALLLHLDDLNPESLELGDARIVRVAGLLAHADGAGEHVRAADREAMTDALARAAAHFGCPAGLTEGDWANGLPIVAAWAPVGPSAAVLPPSVRIRRAWDEEAWPHSTRGYFQLRSAIPRLLDAAGVGGGTARSGAA